MQQMTVSATLDGTERQHLLYMPDAPNGRLVVVLHEAFGIGSHVLGRAVGLAKLGFHALVVDLFAGGRPHSIEEAQTYLEAIYGPSPKVPEIVAQAVQLSRQECPEIRDWAAIGFCFGGTVAVELARAQLDLTKVVCIHGRLTTRLPVPRQMTPSILVITGSRDPMVPPAMRNDFCEEMDGLRADWQLHLLGGIEHGYTEVGSENRGIPGVRYDALADKRCWNLTLEFLAQTAS